MEQTRLMRYTIDKITILNIKISNKLVSMYRRHRLHNTDFTIISNNCWGGSVYRRYGLPYTSPTIGAYFFAEDYIRFCSDLERYLKVPIQMISASESRYAEILNARDQQNVPVGRLGEDVEVIFLHYKTQKEASEKWTKRAKRVNYSNLIVKFSEMNGCNKEHLIAFEKMNFDKKVLLTSKPYPFLKEQYVVKRYTKNGEIVNDTLYYDRYVNLTALINR